MQKNRKRLVIFALVTAIILSCGIPTSIPILPKEVAIKGSPSVSVPLGQVNYNLYSGLSGGKNATGVGSLDNLLGASWLTDLEEQGVKVYDYRPAGSAEDSIQKFLLHYKLNMEDTLGGAGEIDMSEYGGMLKDLTGGKPKEIDDVKDITIPSVNMEKAVDVVIPLTGVTAALTTSSALNTITAYLPAIDTSGEKSFPDDIANFDAGSGLTNTSDTFLVRLKDMTSLTIFEGELKFTFTLTYSPSLSQGKLKLSKITLREANGDPIGGITESSTPVSLDSNGAGGSTSITFAQNTKLPQAFELVCNYEITDCGAGPNSNFFTLGVVPSFNNVTISGVEKMKLEPLQSQSLENVSVTEELPIDNAPGDSFYAKVDTGNLVIGELFPSIENPDPISGEAWNLTMDLGALYIEQGISSTSAGKLSMGVGTIESGINVLNNQTFNNKPVYINGAVSMNINNEDEKGNKLLTFKNFLINMQSPPASCTKPLAVEVKIEMFSTVTAQDTDLKLDPTQTNQTITQNISDFASYKDWLNYVEFAKGGLGANLTIGTLNTVGGLALYIDIDKFNLHVYRPLVNLKDSNDQNLPGALLNLTNNEDGHRIWGKDLPADGEPDNGNLLIKVKLGLWDQTAQQIYETSGIMTITDVVPGKKIELLGMTAGLVFDWAFMSVVPQKPKEGETKNEDLPDYPFTGSFPEADEDGLDLSAMPKELAFYIPGAEDEDGDVMTASLYISLKRQRLDGDVWVDEETDDPEGEHFVITDPYGWRRNLRVNLPTLEFYVRHDDKKSDVNLFSYEPSMNDTGQWALASPINLEAPEFADLVKADSENTHNPFKIYTGSLPNKAIPLGHLAEEFNQHLIGGKNLYFDYTVKLSSAPIDEDENRVPEEIILYPEMLNKKVVASADLLMVLPLRFEVQPNPDPHSADPVTIVIDPDLGDGDLFGRSGWGGDIEFFEFVTSLRFDTSINNMLGLDVGEFYLQNKKGEYESRTPILDFSNKNNSFFLDNAEIEKIKAESEYPFVPQIAVKFKPYDVLRIQRNFNIELQSITVKASGEYTFETGW